MPGGLLSRGPPTGLSGDALTTPPAMGQAPGLGAAREPLRLLLWPLGGAERFLSEQGAHHGHGVDLGGGDGAEGGI